MTMWHFRHFCDTGKLVVISHSIVFQSVVELSHLSSEGILERMTLRYFDMSVVSSGRGTQWK